MIYRPNLFLLFTNFFLFKNVIRISIFCLTIRPTWFYADQVKVSWQVLRISFRISTDIIGYANKVSHGPAPRILVVQVVPNSWELQEQVVLQVQGILIVSWHVIRIPANKVWVNLQKFCGK